MLTVWLPNTPLQGYSSILWTSCEVSHTIFYTSVWVQHWSRTSISVSPCIWMFMFVEFDLFCCSNFGHGGIFLHIAFSTTQYAVCYSWQDLHNSLTSLWEFILNLDTRSMWAFFLVAECQTKISKTDKDICIRMNGASVLFPVYFLPCSWACSWVGRTVQVLRVISQFHSMLAQFEVCDYILPCRNQDCALEPTYKICLPYWRKTAKFLLFYLAIYRFLSFPRSWASKKLLCFIRGGQKCLKHVDRARKPLINCSQLHLFFIYIFSFITFF